MNIRYLGTTERYSEAVCAGGFVFLSGMVPENLEADAKAQTENVLAQIDRWLEECCSDKAHILEATIFLTDMNDYAAMNEAWDAWTAPAAPQPAPASKPNSPNRNGRSKSKYPPCASDWIGQRVV